MVVNPLVRNIQQLPSNVYTRTPVTRAAMENVKMKPGIYIRSYVAQDDATPTMVTSEKSSHLLLRAGMQRAAQSIADNVAKAFDEAQMKYYNNPATMELKGYTGGGRALEFTGRLKESMHNAKITPSETGDTVSMTITWDIPEAESYGVAGNLRKNKSFEYLWAQEFGANMSVIASTPGSVDDRPWRLRARPFFTTALVDAQGEAAMKLGLTYAPVIDLMQGARRLPSRGFGIRLFPSLFSTSTLGMLAYFIPPSIAYAYIGAATDIAGAWSGSLLSETQAFGWGRQYLWGQIGATKKTVRRKFRRKLWS